MDDIQLEIMRLKARGYCCTQIILTLALEAQGKTNTDLVRSVGGLCFGINTGEVCGALLGGACLISLYAGKGSEEEVAHDRFAMMVCELVDWFRGAADDEYGGIRCDEIIEKYPDRSICGLIVAHTYEKCMEILMNHGFDPAVGKREYGHV